jgi:hypothetical protein
MSTSGAITITHMPYNRAFEVLLTSSLDRMARTSKNHKNSEM